MSSTNVYDECLRRMSSTVSSNPVPTTSVPTTQLKQRSSNSVVPKPRRATWVRPPAELGENVQNRSISYDIRANFKFYPPASLGAFRMPLAERALMLNHQPLHHLIHFHNIIPICEVGNWNGSLC